MKHGKLLCPMILLVLLTGCSSTSKVKFDDLNSKNFIVDSISLQSYTAIKQDIPDFISSLPVSEVAGLLEAEYGINIDTDFFADGEKVKANIKQASANGNSLPIWNVNFETENPQRVSITFIRSPNTPKLQVSASLLVYDGDQVSQRTGKEFSLDWSPYEVIADRETAAILTIGKHITVITANDENFTLYEKNNSAGKNAVYIPSGTEYDLLCKIDDPGVFMLFDPATITNIHWKGTLQAGKKYNLSYKMVRSGSADKWTANWVLEEVQ